MTGWFLDKDLIRRVKKYLNSKGINTDKICKIGISHKGKIKYTENGNPNMQGITLDDPVLKMDIRKTQVSQTQWVNPQIVSSNKELDNALEQNRILFEGAFEKALGLYGAKCTWENHKCTIQWKGYNVKVDLSYTEAKGNTIEDAIEETKNAYKIRAVETRHELVKDYAENIIKNKIKNINKSIKEEVEKRIKEHFAKFGINAELRNYLINNAPGGGIHKRAVISILTGGSRQYEINAQILYDELDPETITYTDEDASKPDFEKVFSTINTKEYVDKTAKHIMDELLDYKIKKLVKTKNLPPYILDYYNIWAGKLKDIEPWILNQNENYIREVTEIKTMTTRYETPWFTGEKEKAINFTELGEIIRHQLSNIDMQRKIKYLHDIITKNNLTVSITKGDGIWIEKTTINIKTPYTSTIKTLDPEKDIDAWKQSIDDTIVSIKEKDLKVKQSLIDTMEEPESEILTLSILELADKNNCLTDNTIVQNLRGTKQTISAKVEYIETSGKLNCFPAEKIKEEINRLLKKGFLGKRRYETDYQILYHIQTTIKGKQYLLLKQNTEKNPTIPVKAYIKNLNGKEPEIKNYLEILDLNVKPEEMYIQQDAYIEIFRHSPKIMKQILAMRAETEDNEIKKKIYKKLEKAVGT